jgi:hypothetical protein
MALLVRNQFRGINVTAATYCNISNDDLEYLGKYEAIFEMALATYSGA